MTALFSIDCHACGAKNTIDAETMRRVDDRCRACGAKGVHFCPGNPNIRNVSTYSPEKLERAGRLSQDPKDPEPAA